MARQVQIRRGTAVQHESFTGALAEVTYDSTNNRLIGHDGAKVGGYPVVMEINNLKAVNANAFGAVADATTRQANDGTDSRQAFIDAAQFAVDHKIGYVTAFGGRYHAPALQASDMHDLYIIGGDIEFTMATFVEAISFDELAKLSGFNKNSPTSNRGYLAFEFDDMTLRQWRYLLPLFKKYGIVGGVAYPTALEGGGGNTIAQRKAQMREMYRHGWEVMAHGTNHEDFNTTYGTDRDACEQAAIAMLDGVEEITGSRENISFVYPFHARNTTTDDVLRLYFQSGRGISGVTGGADIIYPETSSGDWLRSAFPIDNVLINGFDNNTKRWLKNLADCNGRGIMYAHDPSPLAGQGGSLPDVNGNAEILESIIKYALNLGIRIEQPRHVIKAGMEGVRDRFFEKLQGVDPEGWEVNAPTLFFRTQEKVLWKNSMKLVEGGQITGILYNVSTPISCNKGFSVFKVEIPYSTDLPIAANSSGAPLVGGNGIGIRVIPKFRYEDGSQSARQTSAFMVLKLKENGNGVYLASEDFEHSLTGYVAIPAYMSDCAFGLIANNAYRQADVYFGSFNIHKVFETDVMTFRLQMTGGTTGAIPLPVAGIGGSVDGVTLRNYMAFSHTTLDTGITGSTRMTIADNRITVISDNSSDSGVVCVNVQCTRNRLPNP